MTSQLLRPNTIGTNSARRNERVVISMKNVKPVTQEQHRRLKDAARDPQKTARRVFPKV